MTKPAEDARSTLDWLTSDQTLPEVAETAPEIVNKCLFRTSNKWKSFVETFEKYAMEGENCVNESEENQWKSTSSWAAIVVVVFYFQPRERGKMRFHMLQNVQTALDFLKYKGVSTNIIFI